MQKSLTAILMSSATLFVKQKLATIMVFFLLYLDRTEVDNFGGFLKKVDNTSNHEVFHSD